MRTFIFVVVVAIFGHTAFAQSRADELLWDRVSDATADRMLATSGHAATAQFYGAISAAQDLLLNLKSFGYNLSDEDWGKLQSALVRLKSLHLAPPEKEKLAKLWRTEILMQLSADDQMEILKFLRSGVGERLLRSALTSRSSVESDTGQRYGEAIAAAESKFNKEVEIILEKCNCKNSKP